MTEPEKTKCEACGWETLADPEFAPIHAKTYVHQMALLRIELTKLGRAFMKAVTRK